MTVKILVNPLIRIDAEKLTDNFHCNHFSITEGGIESTAAKPLALRDKFEMIIYTTVYFNDKLFCR